MAASMVEHISSTIGCKCGCGWKRGSRFLNFFELLTEELTCPQIWYFFGTYI
jgi:hypothetical protein